MPYIAPFPDCPLCGPYPLLVLRLRVQFGVGRRRCGRTLRLFCSAFGEFLLLTPFRLSPLLFLPLHFLLALFERDAHGLLKSSGAPPTLFGVVGLPARFARLASRFAVVLMRESAATATTTRASTATMAARGAFAPRPCFVDLEVAASHFFSVESSNGLRCLRVIGHFHEGETASTACFPISDNMNAPYQPKRLDQRRQIGLRGLKIQVSDKNTFHTISLPGYDMQNVE